MTSSDVSVAEGRNGALQVVGQLKANLDQEGLGLLALARRVDLLSVPLESLRIGINAKGPCRLGSEASNFKATSPALRRDRCKAQRSRLREK